MKPVNYRSARSALLTAVLLCFFLLSKAQIGSLSPVLTGSAGGYSASATMSLSYSVGEPVITTVSSSSLILTQGFQQPSSDSVQGFHFSLSGTGLSCNGANDGTAVVNISSGRPPFTFLWNTMPPQSGQEAYGLAPGTYSCKVTDGSGAMSTDTVTILNSSSICGIHVYSGFSPNGDNRNDTWIIDHIDQFLPNKVTVFNRWGDKVWATANYNNAGNVWKGTDMQNKDVPDGTYYYIIETGFGVQKGWVEVTR